jgi:hypothetical protein
MCAFFYSWLNSFHFLLVTVEVSPVDHTSAEISVQFIEAKVTRGVEISTFAADEKSGKGTVRFHNQCNLPGFREKVVM